MTPRATSAREHVEEDADRVPDVGCHVYGVVRADAGELAELTGIDDAPVHLVVHGAVAAVVSEIRLERPPGRRAELLAYSRVLDALAAAGTVVPVQFGSVLPDAQSVVEELLVPDEQYFAGLLDELAGRSQFNLRASYREDVALAEIVASDPSVAALREHTRHQPEDAAYAERVQLGELVARAMEDKRAFDAEVILDAVVPFTAAHNLRVGNGLDQLADVAVLVDDERREEFEQQLESLAEVVHERIRLRLIGPVAPYDFVGGR